jgi:hypothetical protein
MSQIIIDFSADELESIAEADIRITSNSKLSEETFA